MNHLATAQEILNWIVFTVIIKYVVAKWLAEKISKLLKWLFDRLLLRTKHDRELFMHYFQKRVGKHRDVL